MSNRQTPTAARPKKAKTYKFATIRAEAEKTQGEQKPKPEIAPFVIDDIEPHIVITVPDTLERQMIIAEIMYNTQGVPDVSQGLPLLRALCGSSFPRVWSLVKNDKDPFTLIRICQMLFEHFEEAFDNAMEAEKQPGGSKGSSG